MSKATKSKLDSFQDQLDGWFGVENKTLAEVRELLRAEGCAVSLSRLSDWWSRRQGVLGEEKLLQSIATGARLCRKLDAEMGDNPPPELDTLMRLNRVLIMSLSTTGQANPQHLEMADRMTRTALDYVKVLEKRQDRALMERRVVLLERQVAAAKEVVEATLSPEEQRARLKEILK